MLEHLTLGEFVVALLMALAALSAFVWAAVSGAFRDIEAIKHQVLEVEDDGNERARARSEVRRRRGMRPRRDPLVSRHRAQVPARGLRRARCLGHPLSVQVLARA